MFRITEDPSSWSLVQCLANITRMFLSCPLKMTNNNNNIYLLQLGCYPVAVVILHVYKT